MIARRGSGNADDARLRATRRAAGQAVKHSNPLASVVRGSRATTGRSIQRGVDSAFRLHCLCTGLCAPLPSLPEDKTSLCPSLARPWVAAVGLLPLFNSPESHNMEKTARSFICQPMKSFPVNGLRMHSVINEAKQRNPMRLHSYTLCEV